MEMTVVAASMRAPKTRCAARRRPSEDRQRGADQRQEDGQRNELRHCRSAPSSHRRAQVALDRRSGSSGSRRQLLVEHFLVAPATAADGAVGDVVLDLVVVAEQPAPVGQRQQQRGDAERDHDRRERERLGQRIAEVGGVAGADRAAAMPTAPEVMSSRLAPWLNNAEADDDAAQLALQHEVGADAEEECGGQSERQAHAAPRVGRSGVRRCRSSSPNASKIMKIRPTTTR